LRLHTHTHTHTLQHSSPQARQQLVGRLEGYATRQRPLFARLLDILRLEVLPLLRQGGMAGNAEWTTRERLFTDHPVAVGAWRGWCGSRSSGFLGGVIQQRALCCVASSVGCGVIRGNQQLCNPTSPRTNPVHPQPKPPTRLDPPPHTYTHTYTHAHAHARTHARTHTHT